MGRTSVASVREPREHARGAVSSVCSQMLLALEEKKVSESRSKAKLGTKCADVQLALIPVKARAGSGELLHELGRAGASVRSAYMTLSNFFISTPPDGSWVPDSTDSRFERRTLRKAANRHARILGKEKEA